MTNQRPANTEDVRAILKSRCDYSREIIAVLREVADKTFRDHPELVVGVNGSVARREATTESDLDLFVLTTAEDIGAAKKVRIVTAGV